MAIQGSQPSDLTGFFPGLDVPRAQESIGRVVATAGVFDGMPHLEGTRIPTAVLWEFFEDGADAAEILRAFPVLTLADVQAALDYEAAFRVQST